jgi:hypothetical protein
LRSVTRKRAPMLHLMRQTRLRFNTGAGLIHKFDVARLCDRLLNRPIWRNASNTGWVDALGKVV